MPQPAEHSAPFQLHDRRFVLIGIPVLAVLVLLPRGLLHVRSGAEFVVGWLISLVFTTSFWLSGRALWIALFRRFPRVEQTQRRLWLLALVNTGTTVLVTVGLGSVAALAQHGRYTLDIFLFEFGLNMIPTIIVQLIYESWNLFRQWEQNVRRAEQLTRASVQSQLEALQNQLDPHFLFNSLNTLSALIDEHNTPAQNFVEQLADVYRYVLLSREKATVPLAEELAFVGTYVALQKARFRENLQVAQDVPPEALQQHVAPLSVQLLVENALKHNVTSREHPLRLAIHYEPSGPYLVVENALRPKTAGLGLSTGIGLQNIIHRYELLQASQPVTVTDNDGWFRVRLPLLAR